MDNFEAFNRPGSYPAYTLTHLKNAVAEGRGTALMLAEIAYREARGIEMASK